MSPELSQYIRDALFDRRALRGIGPLLPADDAELDRVVGETVRAADFKYFTFVVEGALVAGRPVAARHLAGGAMLAVDAHHLSGIAWRVQGDPREMVDRKSTRLNSSHVS